MKPRFSPRGLTRTKPWEYAVRFFFGGLITAAAALVAHRWGPALGGLFLAFPAILPASLTLVGEHDGRKKAIDDARGGRLGSVGLVAFAAVVWSTARALPPALVLLLATGAWLAVDLALWAARYGLRRR